MSPYVEAGYAVVLGGLGGYAAILLGRERRAAARLRGSVLRVPVARRRRQPDESGGAEDRSDRQ